MKDSMMVVFENETIEVIETIEYFMDTVTIEVSRRPGDMRNIAVVGSQGVCVMVHSRQFQAKIKGEAHWGIGTTRKEAIGDLIMSHPEKFGIELDWKE